MTRCPIVLLLFSVWGVSGASDECTWTFTDVAHEAGLTFLHERGASGRKHLPETMGAGAAWLDVDNDGRMDLYVVQSGPFPSTGAETAANRLFFNRGDGRFEPADPDFGAGDRGYGHGVTAADYDGDGRVDLFVCNFGIDRLYRNVGQGRFEDVTASAGLESMPGWSSSAAFADADGDGDLDLYVTKYMVFEIENEIFCGDPETGERRYCDPSLYDGARDRYFRNEGNGHFVDATVEAGLESADGKGLGVLFTDLDGDGAPDLYVSNDITPNHLFRNDGSGAFESVSLVSGAAFNSDGVAEAGMGLALGDVDNDGDADFAVSNFDVETNTLYENTGPMSFEDVSARTGFGPPSFNLLGFGAALQDFDRDGDLDYYVTNGHIFEYPQRPDLSWEQRDLLLLRTDAGRYVERQCGPAFEARHVGRGLAVGDYDNDGDVDLALVNNGGPLQLLRNDGAKGSWIGLFLRGKAPNTGAVGARAELVVSGRAQVRWLTAGDSYQSTSDPRILFGWSSDDAPEKLTIHWPNGSVLDIPASALERNRYHTIRQADGSVEPSGSSTVRSGDSSRVLFAVLVFAVVVVAVVLLRRRGR